ncbi:MAG: hypothetical protein IKW52_06030 [Alistipes sp.]|nr:hypothetical protein [Alistipes sp.]
MRFMLKTLFVVVGVVLMVACRGEQRSVEVHDQPTTGWECVEEFSFVNDDTLSMREIAVVLRYDRKDVVDTLSLNIVTISPDSLVLSENMTLRIPRLGDMRPAEQSFPYRRGVVLQRRGEYRFRLTPSVKAEGVGSVGLLITNQSEE